MPPRLRLRPSIVFPLSGVAAGSSPICRACLSTTSHLPSPSKPDVSFSERMRRRLWGKDSPPIEGDPYGGPSQLENTEQSEYQAGRPEAITDGTDQEEGYTPATTWEGLEHVGGSGRLWREQFKKEKPFTGFMNPAPPTTREDLAAVVARAINEVQAFQSSNRSLDELFHPESKSDESEYPSSSTSSDPSVLATPILLSSLFPTLKRITQLTGYRIPDAPLTNILKSHSNTITGSQIVSLLARKPKPTKLSEVLLETEELIGLKNVVISEKRERPEAWDKRIGRWKVIEKELRRRDLPVYLDFVRK
ncbi:MAG: hypothetical protein M1834_007829 [Cirrosporium novae-zelandiae]|nr:MAG: hypothetical protein M1834_007829 [Cirrosporium novae-zelandiae]